MIEDKLDKNERIRLEALNQAVLSAQSAAAVSNSSIVMNILGRAKKFEDYIRGIDLDDGT